MGLAQVHIVGAGLAGQVGALMLARAGYQPVLWGRAEAAPARAIALAQPTVDALMALGVAVPCGGQIDYIHVSRHGAAGHTRLSARALGHAQFGRVVTNDELGDALRVATAGFTQHQEAVEAIEVGRGIEVGGEFHQGPVVLTAPVPTLLKHCGIQSVRRGLNGRLWVGVVEGELQGHAYERFTDTGPLAVLPLGPGRASVVWQCAGEVTPSRLRAVMGRRVALGRVIHQAEVPAAAIWASSLTRPGVAIVGNASQLLHPVAGQGFNLIVRQLSLLAAFGLDRLPEWAAAADAARQPWLATTLTLAQLFQPRWPGQGVALAGVGALPGVAAGFTQRFMEGR